MKINVPRKYHLEINDKVYDLTPFMYLIYASLGAAYFFYLMINIFTLGGYLCQV